MMNEVHVFFHRYRRTIGIICTLISLAAAIGGCGQRGDLYLPADKPKSMLLP
jgi:predicted small lipoprotein YifL